MTPGPENEPGPHWWEASALTTAPTLLLFAQDKEKLLVKVAYVRHHFIQTESSTKQILRWYHQANELQLPLLLKPVKAVNQMTTIWR